MNIPYRGETKDLNDKARENAPGKFIQLSRGSTHFILWESNDGKTIVFVHGIAGPLGIWRKATSSLIEHGFQVLQYDLFGRGYSERPRNPYDIDLFIEQLNELLIALSINLPVTLIGWSLGGMISTIYAARYPNDIERITLIAPTGIDVSLPAISRIGMIPMLGDCIMMLIGRRIILRSLLKGLHRKELIDDYLSLVSEQMEYHGYFQAFLSTLRRCAYKDASSEYESVGNHKLPVMIISGSEDRSIPATVSKRIRELIPNLKCHEIPGTGHLPHFEQPEEVNSLITDFVLSAS